MSQPFPPDKILKLVQMRRNLKGTINAANLALTSIEELLAIFKPKCKQCFNDRGLIEECRCTKPVDFPVRGA